MMKRIYDSEIMDDFNIQDGRIDKALDELKVINKLLGGVATTKSGFTKLNLSNNSTVADIGSGSSDILFSLTRNKTEFKIFSVDKNPRVIKYLNRGYKFSTLILSDALQLPFKEKAFEVVHSSLFIHHFSENEIVDLLKEFFRISRKGIIINDLQRSYLALIGIKLLTTFFSKSEMVKNDAPLSVKRGFTKSELIELLQKAEIKNFSIHRKWAFRWLLVIKK